jgi:hypothetical protein
MPDLPADQRGPAVFRHLGQRPLDGPGEARRQDDLAVALRAVLDRTGGDFTPYDR